jgi:protoporphyrin/coproporphyrin ferrochelatase
VAAYRDLIMPIYTKAAVLGKPLILFSAHGLPIKNIKAGDPYEAQVNASMEAIVEAMAIPDLNYKVTYQSKVGPLEWLGPSTEAEIEAAALAKIPLLVVPVAFVSEHSETLVELDIEYKELAAKHGAADLYFRVPTVSTHPAFIDGLSKLCLNAQEKCRPGYEDTPCSTVHKKCPCLA